MGSEREEGPREDRRIGKLWALLVWWIGAQS